jgi:ADP-ribose pyrophosphatase YjhB (NUDIX family)
MMVTSGNAGLPAGASRRKKKRKIATDPPVSEKQRRAMFAAAAGKSTLGIPKKVGEEYVGKDWSFHNVMAADAEVKKIAAGIVFVAPDGDVLLLKRAGVEGKDNFVGHWALPGGTAESGETAQQCADREAGEEMGIAPGGARTLLHEVDTPNGMRFHTFVQRVEDKFEPRLNEEHTAFGWHSPDDLPSPMHPKVESVLKKLPKIAADELIPLAMDRAPDGLLRRGVPFDPK